MKNKVWTRKIEDFLAIKSLTARATKSIILPKTGLSKYEDNEKHFLSFNLKTLSMKHATLSSHQL